MLSICLKRLVAYYFYFYYHRLPRPPTQLTIGITQ